MIYIKTKSNIFNKQLIKMYIILLKIFEKNKFFFLYLNKVIKKNYRYFKVSKNLFKYSIKRYLFFLYLSNYKFIINLQIKNLKKIAIIYLNNKIYFTYFLKNLNSIKYFTNKKLLFKFFICNLKNFKIM